MHHCLRFYNPIVNGFKLPLPGRGFKVSLRALRASDIAGEWQINIWCFFQSDSNSTVSFAFHLKDVFMSQLTVLLNEFAHISCFNGLPTHLLQIADWSPGHY